MLSDPTLDDQAASAAETASDGFPSMGQVHYIDFLKWLHLTRQPDWYLEIGTYKGASLRHSQARTIAVDPVIRFREHFASAKSELHCYQMTSDQFFASGAAMRLDARIDLAFLDGMHQFEFLLRDFIGTESISNPGGMIVMHDCCPMSLIAAEREWDTSLTRQWTGDVWKIVPILRKYRPDLTIRIVDCPPSGLVLVTGLDPANTALQGNYDRILTEFSPLRLEPGSVRAFARSLDLTSAETFMRPIPTPAPRHRPGQPIAFAIKIPARRRMMAAHSGEFHFATSLAASLHKLGHRARIDCLNVWQKARQPGEVELLLRGLRPADQAEGNHTLLWVLSHGEVLAPAELDRADHSFVSSALLSDRLQLSGKRVSTLMQCTDPARFSPDRADPALACRVLFVGNAYPSRRDTGMVAAALRTGQDIAVWGKLWGTIPEANWKGKLIANADLGRHYASAGVVLNDHHKTMRDAGFVSNRIFDVLACGTPVISDRVAGLPPDLADYVYFADTDDELSACIDAALSESAARRQERRQFAAYVHEHHSFDQRARVIEARVTEILANGKVV